MTGTFFYKLKSYEAFSFYLWRIAICRFSDHGPVHAARALDTALMPMIVIISKR